ncbi:trimeric LpxA-like protein [Tribonema minus]|uniref:serine O-acetyltransferase n=1 Tax=Tribonema minus TaxID=303371 RepID=A0A835Z8T7_9STRA|nr:trimeric LpxA-like protein [Tribonema minus]
MRAEARDAADRESLLVSFIHSTILNQRSLEAALAFHMANKLAGPSMIGTQLQALFLEYLRASPQSRRSVRRDIAAVRERDPACTSYHDALLYFKGFQALQTHRVAHWLYNSGRQALAKYLQSQVNQNFQIDIHPAAKIGEGVFIDHGTGIVIGETAVVGDDCSILHQVTLGGSGTGTGDRHPKVGSGVLIGAGACLLGDIVIGDGAQIGACSLVVEDVPEGCVAVGVPAKVLGRSKVKDPAKHMQQDFYAQVWGGMDI